MKGTRAERDALETRLLAAHRRADLGALSALYAQAADAAAGPEARAFYLTQAWIFALDCGADGAKDHGDALRALNRA